MIVTQRNSRNLMLYSFLIKIYHFQQKTHFSNFRCSFSTRCSKESHTIKKHEKMFPICIYSKKFSTFISSKQVSNMNFSKNVSHIISNINPNIHLKIYLKILKYTIFDQKSPKIIIKSNIKSLKACTDIMFGQRTQFVGM